MMQKLERTKGREVQPPGDGDIRLYHCPFQRLEEVAGIEPNSVNLILTDIPYGEEFLPQVDELAAFAGRVLGRRWAARHVQRAVLASQRDPCLCCPSYLSLVHNFTLRSPYN